MRKVIAMEVIPQPNYCPVEIPKPTPVVKPAEVANKALIKSTNEKVSPWLVVLVVILLIISSGLGYLIVTEQTEIFIKFLTIN